MASPPIKRIWSWLASPSSFRRPQKNTLAPRFAKAIAVACPIPVVAPVISTAVSAKSPFGSGRSGSGPASKAATAPPPRPSPANPAPPTAQSLRRVIKDFVTWANKEAVTHDRVNEIIPDDPNGSIGTCRFRRSLAWHIARRPNGLVALAIQYGHLRTAVSGNYASRARGGVHELINIETARAVADTVAELHADLEAGGGVSGPAAKRAIKAAAAAPRFAGTIITATSARRLLANEDAMLYDNPQSLLLCHYKDRAGLPRRGLKSAKTERAR